MTPSLAQEGVSVAPARATETACLQELFECVVAIECLEHVSGRVARRHACPRVPTSPKMYLSRIRKVSESRHRRQHWMPFAGLLGKPSDGLEPSTPPYHGGSLASRAYTRDHS